MLSAGPAAVGSTAPSAAAAATVRALEARAAEPAASEPGPRRARRTHRLAGRVGFSASPWPRRAGTPRAAPVSAADVLAAGRARCGRSAPRPCSRASSSASSRSRGLVRGRAPLDDPALVAGGGREPAVRSPVRAPWRSSTSADTEVPMTAGVFRPVLVLPDSATGWPRARRRSRPPPRARARRAAATRALRIVSEFVAALYWFHPLAHLRGLPAPRGREGVGRSRARGRHAPLRLRVAPRRHRARPREGAGAMPALAMARPSAPRGARARDPRSRARAPPDGRLAGPARLGGARRRRGGPRRRAAASRRAPCGLVRGGEPPAFRRVGHGSPGRHEGRDRPRDEALVRRRGFR